MHAEALKREKFIHASMLLIAVQKFFSTQLLPSLGSMLYNVNALGLNLTTVQSNGP